jgi:chemotaxis response regulator CheB
MSGNASDSPPLPKTDAPTSDDAITTSTRAVLATCDPMFAALCKRALAGTTLQLLAAVSPPELLATVRRCAPDLLVLDADGQEVAALKALATKVMLVSDARVVLVSAYLAPGSPGLCALLQSIAATFAQKPDGSSSLGLAEKDGPQLVAALQAAFTAHEATDLGRSHPELGAHLPVDFDAGWDIPEEPPARGNPSGR